MGGVTLVVDPIALSALLAMRETERTVSLSPAFREDTDAKSGSSSSMLPRFSRYAVMGDSALGVRTTTLSLLARPLLCTSVDVESQIFWTKLPVLGGSHFFGSVLRAGSGPLAGSRSAYSPSNAPSADIATP